MGDGVGVVVEDHLGVARRPGAEVEEHGVPGLVGDPLQIGGVVLQLLVEVMPALPGAVDQELFHRGGKLPLGLLHSMGDLPVCGADHRRDPGGVDPVDNVLLGEKVGCRDDNRPDLVQGQDGKPKLVVPLEDDQHHIPPLHPMGHQVVGGLAAVPAHVPKGKGPFVTLVVAPNHGPPLRLVGGDVVHAVIGKVEVLRHHRLEAAEDPVFVELLPAELLI